MWPKQRDALAVWADELQTGGEPLGEVIALALRADELRRSGDDPAGAQRLANRAEAARIEASEQLLGSAVVALPGLEITWQLGVVRAVTLRERPGPALDRGEVIEALAELVRRPASRFLDHLHLHHRALDDLVAQLELLEVLSQAESARPRRLILGRMPRRFRVIRPHSTRPKIGSRRPTQPPGYERDADSAIASLAARSSTWLVRDGDVQSLPWAAGDRGSRLQQLERLLAGPWAPDHASLLGRALWDTSERVRRRTIEAIPELPDEAASLLPALLAIDLDGRRKFGDLLERTLTRLSTRPAWVAAVGENFYRCEPWVASWLAAANRRTRPEAEQAIPRMIDLFYAASDDVHARRTLARAIAALGGPALAV